MAKTSLAWRVRQVAGAAGLAAWAYGALWLKGREAVGLTPPAEGLPLLVHYAHAWAPALVFLPFLFPPSRRPTRALGRGLLLLALVWLGASVAVTVLYAKDAVVNEVLFAVDGFVCFGRTVPGMQLIGAMMAIAVVLDLVLGGPVDERARNV
jgi:hypothetical protein